MALKKIYITGVAGQTFVYHPELAFVEIVLFCRECRHLVETLVTPVDRKFLHEVAEGKVQLPADQPIQLVASSSPNDPADVFRPEEFTVEYKT